MYLGLVASLLLQSPWPLTRAERTDYAETSHYEDVIQFLDALKLKASDLRVSLIGESFEKRKIPLAMIAWPPVNSPEEAKRSGKPVIYIQGNIHAGEIEGKEASMMFLRRLCQEANGFRSKKKAAHTLVDKAIFLVNPIYNADGNEKWGPVERNRPEQDGPAQVGLRPNGQGLDLNRDCIKVESPEMSAALQSIYTKWDPDVVMDLHTTDGTRHGFELTYAPPTHPNTDPEVMRIAREMLLPTVRKEFSNQFHQELFDYGNGVRSSGAWRWETFGFEGRYVTNYAGLRNRIGILSEATTFIPFKDRVVVTERFVTLTSEFVASHAGQIVRASRAADRRMNEWSTKHPQLGVRFEMARSRTEEVPIERAPGKKEKRPDALDKISMDIYDRWSTTKTAEFPSGYLLPASGSKVVAKLRQHGIAVTVLQVDWTGQVSEFTADAVRVPAGAFQGHRLVRVDGTFSKATRSFSAGTYWISTAQPLGALIFNILEPESTDGAFTWGMFDVPKVGDTLIVKKSNVVPSVAKRPVP